MIVLLVVYKKTGLLKFTIYAFFLCCPLDTAFQEMKASRIFRKKLP